VQGLNDVKELDMKRYRNEKEGTCVVVIQTWTHIHKKVREADTGRSKEIKAHNTNQSHPSFTASEVFIRSAADTQVRTKQNTEWRRATVMK